MSAERYEDGFDYEEALRNACHECGWPLGTDTYLVNCSTCARYSRFAGESQGGSEGT